jgi:peptidoglycan/xylan/chitin deacetylase (PgdA/CDA1 family)
MLKRLVRDLLVNPIVAPAVRMVRSPSTILLMHRFEERDGSADAISTATLRKMLGWLRRRRMPLVSLQSIIADLARGAKPAPNSVAFTVDDGYADFSEVAVPVFQEFDCPVTLFVTTGPVDRTTWFWWDRLTHAFVSSRSRSLTVSPGGEETRFSWSNSRDAAVQAQALADRLKLVSNGERLRVIEEACAALGVNTSGEPPDAYAAMRWSDVHRLASTGIVHVGPHTVTHPILSRITPDELHHEINESYRRMKEMYPSTIPVFAYPNGRESDYTPPVIQAVRAAGFSSAVTTEQQHVGRYRGRDDAFLIPRLSSPATIDAFTQMVSGLEPIKTDIYRALGSVRASIRRHP